MTTKPPVFEDSRDVSNKFLNEIAVSGHNITGIMYDLDEGTDEKSATSFHAKENFKLEPSVSTYKSREEDLELGKSTNITFEPFDQEKKHYDNCVGNTDDLLTNRVDEAEGRLIVPSREVVFPINVGSLFPLLLQTKNSANDRFRITIDAQPFMDAIKIGSVANPSISGNDIITKTDIRTVNGMNQTVPVGDIKYSLIYKVNKTHYQFMTERSGYVLYERLQEIDQRDIKNIHENGETVDLYTGLHSQMYCLVRNKTKNDIKTISGSEQSVYGLDPDKNDGGELVDQTLIKVLGHEHVQTLSSLFTNKMLPFRTHNVTYPSGVHLLYDFSYKNINLSNAVNMSELRPKLSFVYTKNSKVPSWSDPTTEDTFKPKFETNVIVREVCGLLYSPGKATKYFSSRSSLDSMKIAAIKRAVEDDDDTVDDASKKSKTSSL
ncbi:hypothetical protein SK128_009361 [Halocaridina rubra]|uniref:Uncharacterized protein n=1 Tax=Halocaridina rubra TaxID=373956 RepID=A0AAN8WMT8_HALRR